jgi:hypothetical protein
MDVGSLHGKPDCNSAWITLGGFAGVRVHSVLDAATVFGVMSSLDSTQIQYVVMAFGAQPTSTGGDIGKSPPNPSSRVSAAVCARSMAGLPPVSS